jgi:hypothetical protein
MCDIGGQDCIPVLERDICGGDIDKGADIAEGDPSGKGGQVGALRRERSNSPDRCIECLIEGDVFHRDPVQPCRLFMRKCGASREEEVLPEPDTRPVIVLYL